VRSAVLTEEQIAKLVEAARQGEPRSGAKSGLPRRAPRVRTMNFERPTKFTSDQERRFGRLIESFCRTASTRLSAELRTPVELEFIAATQLTWSSTVAQVPEGSACAIVAVQPLDTRLLMTAELPFLLYAIDALLGGSPQGAIRARRLTEIDWTLAERLFSMLMHQLSMIWQDVADVELSIAGVESSLESVQVAALSEPTLTLAVEVRVGGTSSTLSLHVPFAAIARVASAFSHRDGTLAAPEPGTAGVVDAALRGVAITMRAEVGDTLMTVDQVLELSVGDIVTLGRPAAEGVTIYADAVPVHRAKPGRNGTRRAVQVVGPSERSLP
jgi:flagellar motor switch protein FliM